MQRPDETHDPQLKSWLSSAHPETCDFPIQNLPYCAFRTAEDETACVGVGIGNEVLNLRSVTGANCWAELPGPTLPPVAQQALTADTLQPLMALPKTVRRDVRTAISTLLRDDCAVLREQAALRKIALCPQDRADFQLPLRIGDYTDFYASVYHATNVGSMFRPADPLLPNYKWIPIGYHGRASSLIVSGQPVRRPVGQVRPAEGQAPNVRPSAMLDYELEVGVWVAEQNALGETIELTDAEDHLFGLSLLNDWSARDLQKWEYQPLGPFLAKSFATTVSPWIVTSEALVPFRCPAFARPPNDPAPLPYLDSPANRQYGGFNICLEVRLSSSQMRAAGLDAIRLSRGNLRDLYWTPAQMITHHASNGCNLQPGDLLGSGTVSGRARDSRGCLLELTWDGESDRPVAAGQRTPITLPTGEPRVYLADGDEVILSGYCEADGYRRIGLGTCRGTILPARGITRDGPTRS